MAPARPFLRRGRSLRGPFVVRRIEVEIDRAQRALGFSLAQDDRDIAIQGDAMAEIRSALFVSVDGLAKQAIDALPELVRGLIQANDILVVGSQCFFDFLRVGLCGHSATG